MTKTLFDRRREQVNKQFGDATRGKSLTKQYKTKLLRKLWKKAKKEIK